MKFLAKMNNFSYKKGKKLARDYNFLYIIKLFLKSLSIF